MSVFDGRRLAVDVFRLDSARMRDGWYSDHYFTNIATILGRLAEEGYQYAGARPNLDPALAAELAVGEVVVEMQFFCRREPFAVAAGVDHALAMLSECCGVEVDGRFERTAAGLEVEAVHDGSLLRPWQPALRIRGRYRDFAILETPLLGAMARRTRIATNVYETFVAARGKPILFFPARFDIHETQAGDGYAYRIGLERYNAEFGGDARPAVSTHAQGDWWGFKGGGTIAHSYILSFLGDTAEAVVQFARLLPPTVPRIALVDTNNDCVTDSLLAGRALFAEFLRLRRLGRDSEAEQYRLTGVRADTGGTMRDVSIEPLGDPALDCGVNPRLIARLREALDAEGEQIAVAPDERQVARDWFRGVRIVATGGFDAERIARFEALGVPVDIYGVGSSLLRGRHCDFTADVVQVHLGGEWRPMAKVGRQRRDNPDLQPVRLPLP